MPLTEHAQAPSFYPHTQRWSVMESRIVIDPEICSGHATIRGTRILVKNIIGMVAGGYTVRQIVDAYPELTDQEITAALDYAHRNM